MLAGIGIGQMAALNTRVDQKQAIYERYKNAFSDIDEIEMMPICDYGKAKLLAFVHYDKKKRVQR